jgi:WS/DGAT/MGAT family acyltransferase
MESLTALDAGFLEAEDSDPHISLAIGAVAVMAGPIPDANSLLAVLTQRVRTIPRLRQVIRTYPFDLGAPRWVDDADFDISHHVHRIAVPHPGDDDALFALAADVAGWRLDRDRPLWECWIIEGLAGNRWALLLKVHNCIAHGIAATNLLAQLADDYDGATFADQIRASKAPPHAPELSLDPRRWIHGVWDSSVGLATTAARVCGGAVNLAAGLVRPAAATSLAGRVTSVRRYAAFEVSLEEVAKVCGTFDVTVNDVALAAMADGYRNVLLGRGEEPHHDSVRTLVPVSVRSDVAVGKVDNSVSVMLPYLPVDKADPVEQLRAVHRRLMRTKGSGQRQAGSAATAAAGVLPFPLTAWAIRALAHLPQRGVVALATNVPGPRRRLRIMGQDVERLLPIPPIALGLRTGVAIFSYADKLVFGVTADYDAAPRVGELARSIERALATLVAIGTAPRRSNGKSTLFLVPNEPAASARHDPPTRSATVR